MQDLNLRKFSKDISYTIFRQGLSLLFSLSISVIIARYLGKEGTGIFAICILYPTILAQILSLGLPSSNVYFVASERVNLGHSIIDSILLCAIIILFGGGFGWILISNFGEYIFPNIRYSLLYLSLFYFPVFLGNSIINSFFQGLQDFKRYNISLLSPIIFSFTFLLVAVLLRSSILGVLISQILGQTAGALLNGYLLLNKKVLSFNALSIIRIKSSLSYGIKSHLSNILTLVNYRADIYLINLFLSPAFAGIYLVSVQIVERLWVLSQVTSSVIFPKLSQMNKTGNQIGAKFMTLSLVKWVSLLTVVISLVLVIICPFLIKGLFGKEYARASTVIYFLLPGIIALAISRIISNDIAARGKPIYNFYTSIFTVTLNLLLNVLLVPSIGIIGGAIATSTAYICDFGIKSIIYYKISDISFYDVINLNEIDKKIIGKIRSIVEI